MRSSPALRKGPAGPDGNVHGSRNSDEPGAEERRARVSRVGVAVGNGRKRRRGRYRVGLSGQGVVSA